MTYYSDLLRNGKPHDLQPDDWTRFKGSPGWVKDQFVILDFYSLFSGDFEITEYVIARTASNGQSEQEYQLTLLVGAENGGAVELQHAGKTFCRPNIPGQFMVRDNEEFDCTRGEGPLHSISAMIKKSLMEEHLTSISEDALQVFRTILSYTFRDGDLEVILRGILGSCRRQEAANEKEITLRLKCLIRRMFKIAENKILLQNARNYPDDVKTALEFNISRDVTVQELADILGFSRGHFSRQFRKSLHQSPKQFLKEQRLEIAKKMLREQPENLLIEQIASECGYSNRSHLHLDLRVQLGMSPIEYRQVVSTCAYYKTDTGTASR